MAEAVPPPFGRPDAGFNQLAGWTWVGCYGGYYLQADLLAGFEHGFFTRQWQGRSPEVLVGYLSAGVTVHRPQQVHGAVVLPASMAVAEPWPQADGLVSDAGAQSLWVCGADCTPVLLADPRSGRVAACHAGWRGVAGRILPAAVAQLEAAGSRAADLLVALGPAVSGPRYQVLPEVSAQVALSLAPDPPVRPPISPTTASVTATATTSATATALEALQACGGLLSDPDPGHDRLDIRAAARAQLVHGGIPADQIATCPLCTVTESELFHSWRRDQVRAVQWSGIVSQG